MTSPLLTTADKGALLDAKARGANWIARDENFLLGEFIEKPTKVDHYWMGQSQDENWGVDDDNVLKFIQWSDPEPVNIDLALAQIAEMESKQNNALSEKASEKGRMTWNERINQMTVEEKAGWLIYELPVILVTAEAQSRSEMYDYDCMREALEGILNSPYTEGGTE